MNQRILIKSNLLRQCSLMSALRILEALESPPAGEAGI